MNKFTDYSFNRPHEFIGLTEEELKYFSEHGIDGDNLRKCDNYYVTLYDSKYYINENNVLVKVFDFL